MNRIQSKYHRIETYEINKISLSSLDNKIHTQNNEYNGGLALGYHSYLSNYLKKPFCQAYCFIFSLVRTAFLSSILF